MLDMVRLRIDYWLGEREIRRTAYALAKASKGAINETTAKRLIEGPKRVDLVTLDVLCTVFDCEPGELWERDPVPKRPPRAPSGKPASTKRKRAA